ncbi:MAG TPA: hypothetical protein VJ596_11685 [Gemmatimonadaceae bacterium]|nr:hypothetical protein [Gemmatimonadaceae bacterium]
MSLVRWLSAALLLGSALLGAGAAMHPVLPADATAQLQVIADMGHWRAVHLMMLAGSGLVITGLWARLLVGRQAPSRVMLGALGIIALGVALNALNIAYMAGAGTLMAEHFQAGDATIARVFEATHPIGLMAARFGNFLIALGAIVLGWSEWQSSGERTAPLLAGLAWVAGAGGLIGVLFFSEASRMTLAAVALISGWQLVVGFLGLRGGRDVAAGRGVM